MSKYSTAATGCVQRILATLRIPGSEANYEDFVDQLCASVSVMQGEALEYVFSFSFF